MWVINIEVEDGEKQSLTVDPSIPIGNLILQLSSKLDESHSWSEYNLWYEEKNIWLESKRTSLDEYNLYNGVSLKFLKTIISVYVILPDLEVIETNVDISSNLIYVVKNICDKINLRKCEEMSLMIFKNSEFEEYQRTKLKKSDNLVSIYSIVSNSLKQNKNIKKKFELILDANLLDLFPKSISISDLCAFHENWAITSMSLKSQGFTNRDILFLRYKYCFFPQLNPNVDPIRFHYIFSHCAHSIKTLELHCTELEMYDLCAMLLIVQMHQNGLLQTPDNNELTIQHEEEISNVDDALSNLEKLLSTKSISVDSAKLSTTPSNLIAVLPSKTSKNAKLTVLTDELLTIYKGTTNDPKFIETIVKVRGGSVTWDIDTIKHAYKIKITINDKMNKSIVTKLKFNDDNVFVEWLVSVRSVCRGLTIHHKNSYNESALTFFYLDLKKNIAENANIVPKYGRYTIDDFFPQWFYKTFDKSRDQVLEKFLETSFSYTNMKLIDVERNFINRWKGTNLACFIPFKVTFSTTSEKLKKKQPDILGVFDKFIAQVDYNNEQIIKKWDYRNLRQWTINKQKNSQEFTLENERLSFISLTCDIQKIHECIGGNVYMNTKADSTEAFDMPLFIKLTT